MRVKDLMQSKVFTVDPEEKVDRVFYLLHYERIRHLPVVERGKVVGIVSDRDLYKALGPRSRRRSRWKARRSEQRTGPATGSISSTASSGNGGLTTCGASN